MLVITTAPYSGRTTSWTTSGIARRLCWRWRLGNAEQFFTEAQLLAARNETSSCQVATALARVQTRIAQSRIAQSQAGFDVMSAREEAQVARFEANRARMEAQIAAQTAHIRIATAAFAPIMVKGVSAQVVCPRVHVNIPRPPMIKMPVIHVNTGSAGPV